MHEQLSPKSKIRERAEQEQARTELRLETERAEVRARLDADQAQPAEVAALAHVRDLQSHGAPYEAALVALGTWQGLTPGARAAVADVAYAVGVACEEADPGAALPELDVDDLFADVPVVAARAREVATMALTVPDMPAMAALAFASAACAARVVGVAYNKDGSEWRNWPHFYFAPTAPSGCKKSLVRDNMGGEAMAAYAADLARRWQEPAAADEDDRKLAESRKKSLLDSAAKGKPPLDPGEPARLRARLARPCVVVPRPTSAGGTPEQCVRRVQDAGCLFLAPDEGWAALRPFIAGREGHENVDPLLCMWSHSKYENDTIAGVGRGDKPQYPTLAGGAYLAMQPSVLEAKTPDDAMLLRKVQDRGLLARMLISQPRQLRVAERRAMREATQIAQHAGHYDTFLRGLLWDEGADHPLRPAVPKQLRFADDANAALLAFQAEAEDSAAPGGHYEHRAGAEFVRRQADHVARLAVVLAVLRMGKIADGVVELADVERACRAMTRYFLPHALAVAARTVHDPIGDDADRVLKVIRESGQLTQRELQLKLGAGWGKAKPSDRASRLDGAVEELAGRGRIVVEKGARGSKLIRVVGVVH